MITISSFFSFTLRLFQCFIIFILLFQIIIQLMLGFLVFFLYYLADSFRFYFQLFDSLLIFRLLLLLLFNFFFYCNFLLLLLQNILKFGFKLKLWLPLPISLLLILFTHIFCFFVIIVWFTRTFLLPSLLLTHTRQCSWQFLVSFAGKSHQDTCCHF